MYGRGHDREGEQVMVLIARRPELLDTGTRLVRLLEKVAETAVLAPLVEREILYRLICSDQGVRLWQIAHRESRLQQINRAIGRLQRDIEKPITVAELAAVAGMSVRSEAHTSELQSLVRI